MADISVSRLRKLAQMGQSPWYDNIDRRLIENGELKKLFDLGIKGVTSNPTIFEKAVQASSVYDAKILKAKEEGKGLESIYDELTADDVRDAADMLQGVYEQTKGVDGYVSIEVLPAFAHDAVKTVRYALDIFNKVDRKNIMVKVPGTEESPEIIRSLVREGVNINVTLLFSLAQYERVALAYIEGLRDRLNRGLDVSGMASVASVFVSRIDTKVDNILNVLEDRETGREARQKFADLKGKIAIANCKFIYQRFKDLFSDRNFGELKMRGARAQRPLWASTSTKNPAYNDCIYVDNLIGPETVNTMPHATVEAFLDHGHVALTLGSDIGFAGTYLSQLQDLNIDLETICEEAQGEGVMAFQRSFESLLASISLKAKIE
jgi:transaldolase